MTGLSTLMHLGNAGFDSCAQCHLDATELSSDPVPAGALSPCQMLLSSLWESSTLLCLLRSASHGVKAHCSGWRRKHPYTGIAASAFMVSAWLHPATQVRGDGVECKSCLTTLGWWHQRCGRDGLELSEVV